MWIQGTTSHRTHLVRGWLKSTSPKSLKKLKGGSLKEVSQEFSRTESRILGFLSKLDLFLLNPQNRTCSVVVPGTSRNNNSENREPTRDRSLNDPCPEVLFSACHTSNLNESDQEETHHIHIYQHSQWKYLVQKWFSRNDINKRREHLFNIKFHSRDFSLVHFLLSIFATRAEVG